MTTEKTNTTGFSVQHEEYTAPTIKTAFDATGMIWEQWMTKMLEKSAHIVALRGAGSYNGISVSDANEILMRHLIPRVESYLSDGHVSVIYDGDDDEPTYPDIGHIMGRLRDYFHERVDWYAVQMQGWYRYNDEFPTLRPLHSAEGNEYCTIVFPDKKFSGEHDYFSQNARLAQSPTYEQWYIGACGQIASKQLADYSAKVSGIQGQHKAIIFRAPVSIQQEQALRKKLQNSNDLESRQRWNDALMRRAQHPYGLLCTQDGKFIELREYSGLRIEVI